MEGIDFIFTMLGAALNGAMQVLTDFLNLVIESIPNPDPFPEIIENMPTEIVIDKGFVIYWIDQAIGVSQLEMLITTFTVLWLASLAFAVVYKMTGFAKL